MTLALAPPRANPFVGPRPLAYGELLHGRRREVRELADLLVAARIVLLYAPSGAGKTSLVEAGLRPELERRDFRVLPTARVGLAPPAGGGASRYTLSVLAALDPEHAPGRRAASLAEHLDARDGDDDLDTCLVVDQLEELFTLDPTDVEAKRAFVADLGRALRDRRRWAVLALREDFVAALDPYLGLVPTALSARYRLDLLGADAARAVVTGVAATAGARVTDAAARRLVDDLRAVRVERDGDVATVLGPAVEPVQLQVVGRRLWEVLGPETTVVDEADVARAGATDDALGAYYDEQVATAADGGGVTERALREWCGGRLLTADGWRAQVTDVPPGGATAVARLVDAHLVRAERRRGTTWFELAHDRLVAPVLASNERWRRAHLQPWQAQAAAWDVQGRPAELLLAGDALDGAARWVDGHGDEATSTERDLVRASQALRARRRRRRRVALGLVAALAVTAALALDQAVVARRAEQRARDAQAAVRDLLGALAAVAPPPADPARRSWDAGAAALATCAGAAPASRAPAAGGRDASLVRIVAGNGGTERVVVTWTDTDGRAQPYATLDPGESVALFGFGGGTGATRWQSSTPGGRCLARFTY